MVAGDGLIADFFCGKCALLSLTTGGPAEAYRNGALNGDIVAILRPVHRGLLQFVGFDVLSPHVVYAPARLTEAQRYDQLAMFASRLRSIFLESPINVGPY